MTSKSKQLRTELHHAVRELCKTHIEMRRLQKEIKEGQRV